MQKWLLEFLKEVTKGHWEKRGIDFYARVYNISVEYFPAQNPREESIINIYLFGKDSITFGTDFVVDPHDWVFTQRDVTRNRSKAREQQRPEGRKPCLYIVMGPPASGKTRYIAEHFPKLPVVSPDLYDPYDDLTPDERWWNKGGPDYHKANIGKARSWAWQEFGKRLQQGADFVFEATLAKTVARSPLINLAKAFGYEVTCIYNCESLQTLLERNSERVPRVDPDSVARIYLDDQEPSFDEGWDKIVLPQEPPTRDLVVFAEVLEYK
jgi:predicted kinase